MILVVLTLRVRGVVRGGASLTYGVDVEEADRCAQYGSEHAIVQSLRGPHQHVEHEEVPEEPKEDGGQRQTWTEGTHGDAVPQGGGA